MSMHLTLRTRLLGGFGVLLVLIAVAAAAGIWAARTASSDTQKIFETSVASRALTNRALEQFESARSALLRFLDTESLDDANQARASLESVSSNLDQLSELVSGDAADGVQTARTMVAESQALAEQIISLVTVLGLTADQGLEGQLRSAVHAVENKMDGMQEAQLRVYLLMARRYEKDYLLRGLPRYLNYIYGARDDFIAYLPQSSLNAATQREMVELWETYIQGIQAFAENDQQMRANMTQFQELAAELDLVLREVAQWAMADTETGSTQLLDNMRASETLLIVLFIIAVITAIIVGWLTSQSITRPLGNITQQANRLAEGILIKDDAELREANDEISALVNASRTLNQKLRDVVGGIKLATETVSNGSEQVSAGNTELSARTQEQAASLEEIAAGMEEMVGAVDSNSRNAVEANELAKEAQQKAQSGKNVAIQVQSAMQDIQQSSKKVTEFLELIQEISFKTNLLALNAAVEAARAGEHGRGFAVVASEVRALANRSSEAADDIKSLIQQNIKNIKSGVDKVNESNAVLEEILNAVEQAADVVGEITAASAEQAEGISEINRSITQMDGMTQQNAALVEEIAATSMSMRDQANTLENLVSFFQLHQEQVTDAREPQDG